MFSKNWHIIQRVGLTESEDEYLESLQQALGFRYRHQVLRFIITQHREQHDNREKPTKSAGRPGNGKPSRRGG